MNQVQMPVPGAAGTRFLVVGCGSNGKRHIGNLKSLGADTIIVADPDTDRRREAASCFDVETFPDLTPALDRSPDVALICTPNAHHVENALSAARAGCHLFVEKPLSHNLAQVEELIAEIEERDLVTLIGCNFKFHPSFLKMKEILETGVLGKILSARCQFGQYLPDWHPWEDYRRGYSARCDLGGGILLDSHEFDYMRWFLGDAESVFCLLSKASRLEIDTEDTAEVLLRFANGTIAEIHLDYTQRIYQRNYEFFGEKGTLRWDFNDRSVWLYLSESGEWEIFDEPADLDLNEMYRDEMEHFLRCIEESHGTITDIHSGRRVLETILAAKDSARDGCLKPLEVG